MKRLLKVFTFFCLFLLIGYLINTKFFQFDRKIRGNGENTKKEIPDYQELMAKLTKDEFESLGFMAYNDVNRLCTKIDHTTAWNVMCFTESKDNSAFLVNINNDHLYQFKFLDEASYRNKFSLLGFNEYDVNHALLNTKNFLNGSLKVLLCNLVFFPIINIYRGYSQLFRCLWN